MVRSLKMALLTIACIIGLPVAAFLAWDTMTFRPHLADIERILAEADPEDRQLTPDIHRLIDANIRGRAWPHAGRLLCARFDPRPGNRHMTRFLWGLSTRLHFDRNEHRALLAILGWNGTDAGLNRHALRTYGRPLSRLTTREAARVVAWTHGPSIYRNNADRLESRANHLLQEAGLP